MELQMGQQQQLSYCYLRLNQYLLQLFQYNHHIELYKPLITFLLIYQHLMFFLFFFFFYFFMFFIFFFFVFSFDLFSSFFCSFFFSDLFSVCFSYLFSVCFSDLSFVSLVGSDFVVSFASAFTNNSWFTTIKSELRSFQSFNSFTFTP